MANDICLIHHVFYCEIVNKILPTLQAIIASCRTLIHVCFKEVKLPFSVRVLKTESWKVTSRRTRLENTFGLDLDDDITTLKRMVHLELYR